MTNAQFRAKREARVVFLTQFWYPEIGAPQIRLGEWARHLRALGWQVLVVTAQPNYPTGRIYAGYSRWRWTTEAIDGVQVHRCPVFPTKAKRTLPRLVSYLSFAASSALRGLGVAQRQDILVVESPPLFTALPARLIGGLRRCKYVFNVSDLWPDSAIEMGWVKSKRTMRCARILERWAYRGAAALTGQSPAIVKALAERNPSKPVDLLTNGVDIERFASVQGREVVRHEMGFRDDDVVAVYAGLHGVAQGLEQVIEAANRLRSQSKLHFLLVGDGPDKEELRLRAQALKLDNVRFLEPVPSSRIPSLLGAADIALVTLRYALTGAVPSKIYEGMAAGLPVVFVGEGDGVEVIRDNHAGICCRIGDSAALDSALLRLVADRQLRRAMGRNGQEAVRLFYSRAAVAAKLNDILAQVVGKTTPAAPGPGGTA